MLAALIVVGNILFQEHFDDPHALSRWKVTTGAALTDSACPTSTAKLDAEALRLSATKKTCKWLALEREISIADGGWIEVSARMRSEKVDLAAPVGNAYFSVGLPGKKRVSFRMFNGTQPWTHLSRLVGIPAGTKTITLVCFLSAPGNMWFDDIVVARIDAPRFTELRRGPLLYRVLGPLPTEEQLRFNDETLRLTTQLLSVSPKGIIKYFKYPNRDVKEQLTGNGGNGHVDESGILHTIWPTDRHELVHVLAEQLGNPPALVAEGLAVHVSAGWQGRPLRAVASELLRAGKWISLDRMLETNSFRREEDNRTYPIAGVFVGWILEQAGSEKLLTLYRQLSTGASIAANRRAIKQVLGMDLRQVDQHLRDSLAKSSAGAAAGDE